MQAEPNYEDGENPKTSLIVSKISLEEAEKSFVADWINVSKDTREINLALLSEEIYKSEKNWGWKFLSKLVDLEDLLSFQYYLTYFLLFLSFLMLVITSFAFKPPPMGVAISLYVLTAFSVYSFFTNTWFSRLKFKWFTGKKVKTEDVMLLFSTLINNDLFDKFVTLNKITDDLVINNQRNINNIKSDVLVEVLNLSNKKFLIFSPLIFKYYSIFYGLLKAKRVLKKEESQLMKVMKENLSKEENFECIKKNTEAEISEMHRDFLLNAISKLK